MEKLSTSMQSPSAWDSAANMVIFDQPDDDLYVLLCRTRDSDLLSESNWEVALEKLGGESDDVQILRFGHWACGWLEYLCVREGTPQYQLAEEMEESLDGYPVLDDEHYSNLESETADRLWKEDYSWRERVEHIRENLSDMSFHNFKDLLGCVRGHYYAGQPEFLGVY